jgi:hypothetical protein
MAITQIKGSNIEDGTVVAADVANDAVTTDKILDNAVTQGKIASSVVLGGPSLGTSAIIRTNGTTLTENITFPASAPFSNGITIGPLSFATYTVTVPAGNTWTII